MDLQRETQIDQREQLDEMYSKEEILEALSIVVLYENSDETARDIIEMIRKKRP